MFLWRAVKLILEYHVMKQPDSLVTVHTNGSLDNEPSSQKFAIVLFPIKVNGNTLRGSNYAIFIFTFPPQRGQLKRKGFAPLGAKSFLLELTSFWKKNLNSRGQIQTLRNCPPL